MKVMQQFPVAVYPTEEEKEEETRGEKNERHVKKGLVSVALRFKGGVNKKLSKDKQGK